MLSVLFSNASTIPTATLKSHFASIVDETKEAHKNIQKHTKNTLKNMPIILKPTAKTMLNYILSFLRKFPCDEMKLRRKIDGNKFMRLKTECQRFYAVLQIKIETQQQWQRQNEIETNELCFVLILLFFFLLHHFSATIFVINIASGCIHNWK